MVTGAGEVTWHIGGQPEGGISLPHGEVWKEEGDETVLSRRAWEGTFQATWSPTVTCTHSHPFLQATPVDL